MKIKKILYIAMMYDYGNSDQGYSFEHYNFYHTLINMGFEGVYFDFMSLIQQYGKSEMNRLLLETAKRYKPDVAFFILYTDEFYPETIQALNCPTFNWFCDDHWRYEDFSRHWAGHFMYASTTSRNAFEKYRCDNINNVLYTQWACNHFLYKPCFRQYNYDVTFVGQPHGDRRTVMETLQKHGISVQCWGRDWENGRISQEDMISVFSNSKINLNLTNNWMGTVQQIKGRNFEVPGCGGFLLTGMAENLEDYYKLGKEVVCFDRLEDLIRLIQYYLQHEKEREQIAKSGYERTIREHTYEQRLREIFEMIEKR